MTAPRITYAHLLTEPNPKHVESLVKFFESGCQGRGTGGFGVEIEHLPVHNSDDTAVNYYEENGIEALLNRIRPYYDESKEFPFPSSRVASSNVRSASCINPRN